MNRLSIKQERFVQATLKGLNGFEAAKEAKYKGNDNTLRAIASENLTKPNIKQAIDEQRAEMRLETRDEIEKIDEGFTDLQFRAKKAGDRPTEARCLENKAKNRGYYEKDNLQRSEQVKLDDKTEAEVQAFARWSIAQRHEQAAERAKGAG